MHNKYYRDRFFFGGFSFFFCEPPPEIESLGSGRFFFLSGGGSSCVSSSTSNICWHSPFLYLLRPASPTGCSRSEKLMLAGFLYAGIATPGTVQLNSLSSTCVVSLCWSRLGDSGAGELGADPVLRCMNFIFKILDESEVLRPSAVLTSPFIFKYRLEKAENCDF